jgi:peptidoglycan/xylan/chitin deacetylase (PgdA/CDA1 family)
MTSATPAQNVYRGLRSRLAPAAKSAMLRLGALGAVRAALPNRHLAILRYHAICGDEGHAYAAPEICVTPASFEEHVRYLAGAYRIMSLPDVVAAFRAGTSLPANVVIFTFDDGYADNFAAAQVLERYGATGTFYLTAGCLAGGAPFWPAELRYLVTAVTEPTITLQAGAHAVSLSVRDDDERRAAVRHLTRVFKASPIPVREQLRDQLRALAKPAPMPRVMLTWDEVRRMQAMGMTIAAHTMTHPNLPSAGLAAATAEIQGSRARLEEETGAPVTMFSYPNGGADRYFTPELQAAVANAGFLAATTSRNGFAPRGSDLYSLPRIEVRERIADLVFALEVERFAFRPK